ncbi:MAG: tRNA (adenosine(37)-N6)-dimethylallyltransferase MiaA [Chitinophagaceae bacterium]
MADLMMEKKKTCIIVCGPTAVGKTGIALELAKAFNTKIISADSRQCYKELNIGVAKPSEQELASVPHFFINSHSIFDEINVADFVRYADSAIAEIFSSHDVAIMVGGTGLYIDAFCNGLDNIPEVDPEIRITIRQNFLKLGIAWLQAEVKQTDPEYAANDDLSNPQRMMRALEVIISTGKSIKAFQTAPGREHDFAIVRIALELPRDLLYERINDRVDQMIKAGLIEEVQGLLQFEKLNALNTVGYKELFAFLQGQLSLETSIGLIKQNSRRYAKRQLTWFKRDHKTRWFFPDQWKEIKDYCYKTN